MSRYIGVSTLVLILLLRVALGHAQEVTNLAESNIGRLAFTGNELLVKSTVNDPPAVRGSAPETQRSLFKISGNIDLGGSFQELVLLQFKQTEGPANNQLGSRGGEFYLGLAKPGFGSTDDAMVDALTVTVDGGFRFTLPIYAPNLTGGGGGGSGAWPGCMASGPYQFCQQGTDGNVVSYQVVKGVACARWSAYHGLIPKHTAVGVCRE